MRAFKSILILTVILGFASVSHAQTATCDSTACFNVGDTVTFTISPVTGAQGYNIFNASIAAGIPAVVATNAPGANFFSLGATLTYSFTATAAMVGQTFWGVNAWTCAASPCLISPTSGLLSVRINPVGLTAPSLTVSGK